MVTRSEPARGDKASPLPGEAWGSERIILHADMDAFYAAIEQLDRPELRGRPVIVGGPSHRGVVSTASYEARPFGVHSAMPMAEARRRCPEAVVVSPRFDRYGEASSIIMQVFSTFSPRVEPLSLDEAFLDMSGSEKLFGSVEQMGLQLKGAVFEATGGLRVSVGISTTKFVAKVASDWRKPDALTLVPAAHILAFLWPLPVTKLWGVGPSTAKELERIGLRTIGDVGRSDRRRLERELGSLGEHLHRLAWADDPRGVEPDRQRLSLGAEMTLEHDIVGARAIVPHLRSAAERVARGLRDEGLLAGGVRVKLKTRTFKLHTRQRVLEQPTDSARPLVEAAEALLGEFDLRSPMRLVGLAAFQLTAETQARQRPLFPDVAHEKRRTLDRLMDSLQDKYGETALRRGEPEE